MAKYRKKPVVVEAQQFTDDAAGILLALWCGGKYFSGATSDTRFSPVIYIETLEGLMEARLGDWIIKGVQGEFYPCKPDIFEATYELVEE